VIKTHYAGHQNVVFGAVIIWVVCSRSVMSTWTKILDALGFGTRRRSLRDVVDYVLGVAAVFASVILLVYAFERKPSPEFRRTAIESGVVLVIALVFVRYRMILILAIIAFIGFRGLVAALVYRSWPGLAFAVVAGILLFLGRRWLLAVVGSPKPDSE
jgi:hypothetical protein